jgi:hypothetical protein
MGLIGLLATSYYMLTDRTRANGLGYIDRGKMEKTLDFTKKYQDIKDNIAVDDIYSLKYLSRIDIQ